MTPSGGRNSLARLLKTHLFSKYFTDQREVCFYCISKLLAFNPLQFT